LKIITIQKFHLDSLKVSAYAKITVECFENFRGGKCPKCSPPGCAPAMGNYDLDEYGETKVLQRKGL